MHKRKAVVTIIDIRESCLSMPFMFSSFPSSLLVLEFTVMFLKNLFLLRISFMMIPLKVSNKQKGIPLFITNENQEYIDTQLLPTYPVHNRPGNNLVRKKCGILYIIQNMIMPKMTIFVLLTVENETDLCGNFIAKNLSKVMAQIINVPNWTATYNK